MLSCLSLRVASISHINLFCTAVSCNKEGEAAKFMGIIRKKMHYLQDAKKVVFSSFPRDLM